MDRSQTHLELSLNIIDAMSEFLTSKKKTSYSGPLQGICFHGVLLSPSIISVYLPFLATSTELNKCLQHLLKDAKFVISESTERGNV